MRVNTCMGESQSLFGYDWFIFHVQYTGFVDTSVIVDQATLMAD